MRRKRIGISKARKTAGKLLLIPLSQLRCRSRLSKRTGARLAASPACRAETRCAARHESHNVRYLTGFTGSNGAVLLCGDEARDPVHRSALHRAIAAAGELPRSASRKGPLTKSILQEIDRAARAPGRIRAGQSHRRATGIAEEGSAGARRNWNPMSGLIERLRMVKDAGEIERIRASVIANSRALEAALKRFRIGMRESELAAEIDYRNRKLGRRSAVVRHHRRRGRALGVASCARRVRRRSDREFC